MAPGRGAACCAPTVEVSNVERSCIEILRRSFACPMGMLQIKNFGGAERNRTADKGFADLCLTTWRPRHRVNPELLRQRPRARGPLPFHPPQTRENATPTASS